MSLTNVKIINAKPRQQSYKLADGNGLHLHVNPNGRKWWRFRYRYSGREKMLSMGTYPDTSLKLARKKIKQAREQLSEGLDPSVIRQAAKAAQTNSFEAISNEWFDLGKAKRAETTNVRDQRILKKLQVKLGKRPLSDITAPEMLSALRSIEKDGAHETTHRALGLAGRIYGYALSTGKAMSNPTAGLQAALKPVVTRSRSAITDPKQVGKLMLDIDSYIGAPVTRMALQLLALTFTRPGELRQAQWDEIDLQNGQWIIPANRAKMRREHVVPLSSQAVSILTEVHRLTGRGNLVFPNSRRTPLSENAFTYALKKLGYTGEVHHPHGFRSTASTLLHEHGFPAEVIETQLAHARSGVSGIYNRSHLLPKRRELMQFWSDYLDSLRTAAKDAALHTISGA